PRAPLGPAPPESPQRGRRGAGPPFPPPPSGWRWRVADGERRGLRGSGAGTGTHRERTGNGNAPGTGTHRERERTGNAPGTEPERSRERERSGSGSGSRVWRGSPVVGGGRLRRSAWIRGEILSWDKSAPLPCGRGRWEDAQRFRIQLASFRDWTTSFPWNNPVHKFTVTFHSKLKHRNPEQTRKILRESEDQKEVGFAANLFKMSALFTLLPKLSVQPPRGALQSPLLSPLRRPRAAAPCPAHAPAGAAAGRSADTRYSCDMLRLTTGLVCGAQVLEVHGGHAQAEAATGTRALAHHGAEMREVYNYVCGRELGAPSRFCCTVPTGSALPWDTLDLLTPGLFAQIRLLPYSKRKAAGNICGADE
ncbi:hypothetical protein DV515_00003223, partial [Chloebia gouldiae]